MASCFSGGKAWMARMMWLSSFGDGSTEVAAVAVLFTAFAVHARPADEDTDGNLEKISHFQEY